MPFVITSRVLRVGWLHPITSIDVWLCETPILGVEYSQYNERTLTKIVLFYEKQRACGASVPKEKGAPGLVLLKAFNFSVPFNKSGASKASAVELRSEIKKVIKNKKGLWKIIHKPFVFKTHSVKCFCKLVFFIYQTFCSCFYQLFY